ncbi:hypothetical protein [Ulvibacterium marinum]|uniref:Uncharacterized protein n=1 Tax=Ulvibacterium marinum TaxID=2419782 RepID=A0A3B0CEU7_9FLAO|nr:hypothetical protein [Ulvibacterium marinum]RKN82549.1 hypothetical protein D7Z94_01495 [Ulvibacterium marinum]
MDTLTLVEIIDRPEPVVIQSLMEGLGILMKDGLILSFSVDCKTSIYSFRLNGRRLCGAISDSTVMICTKRLHDGKSELKAIWGYEMNYTGPLKRFFTKMLVKHMLRKWASEVLAEFKYRVEKWT